MKVRLYIRVRLPDGSRQYADPVYLSNGKPKPLYALVDGKPEHHPEGVYHLRYCRADGKRAYEAVGNDVWAALTARLKRERTLEARAVGIEVHEPDSHPKGRDLNEAAAEYLAEVKAGKSHKTHIAYRVAIREFIEHAKVTTLEELSRPDVLAYTGALRDRGMSPRTIATRISYIKTLFLHYGLPWPMLKTDRIKYTEKDAEAYSTEQLQSLFAAADQDETDLFQFMLCTGVREQEAMYATWRDLDFARKTFKVTEKLDLGFIPKDREEGIIPIPDTLVVLLQARRRRYPNSRLIFPGPHGRPDGHMLRTLKSLAFRAGLNCGECTNKAGRSCKDHAVCHQWGLHRFRKTFATMHHEAGVPVRTIQRWLRHSSLDTTLRYLAGSDDRSERTRQAVNNTFAGLSVPAGVAA